MTPAVPAPLLAIDAPSLLYRAFFALPEVDQRTPTGSPVNALLGMREPHPLGRSSATARARSSCASAPRPRDYRTELFPATTPTARRCPRSSRASGPTRPRSSRPSAGPSLAHDDARGRRPARRVRRGRDRGRRRRAARSPATATCSSASSEHGHACCYLARRQGRAELIDPAEVRAPLRHRARAGARLHRAARRPVRRPARAPRASARRPPRAAAIATGRWRARSPGRRRSGRAAHRRRAARRRRRAARVQRDRDAAPIHDSSGPPDRPTDLARPRRPELGCAGSPSG